MPDMLDEAEENISETFAAVITEEVRKRSESNVEIGTFMIINQILMHI